MIIDFICQSTINIFRGLGNTLLNGFDSNISKEDRARLVNIRFADFIPVNQWRKNYCDLVDMSTGREYFGESTKTVRLKCAATFAASFIVQPVGLTLNLLNRIAKIVTFAHLWHPFQEKYSFKARICEWGMDILRVVLTPLIFIGMLFSSLYGASLSPYDGRKLYASFERLAYSGGYQRFEYGYGKDVHRFLLTPCFQPAPTAHLGGGDLDEVGVW